jgi:hypothetical protein
LVSAADPLRLLISVFWTVAATFRTSSSSFILTRLSGSRSRPTATQKMWQRRESNPGPLRMQPGTLATRPQSRSDIVIFPRRIARLSDATAHALSQPSLAKQYRLFWCESDEKVPLTRGGGRGFESFSKNYSLSEFIRCLCCSVYVAAARADPHPGGTMNFASLRN